MPKIDVSQYGSDDLGDFLSLIRDRYSLADEANFFLEQSGVASISVAIANQRDAVSHFVSFLNKPGSEHAQYRQHQISAAEEHLRRAIIEPYQLAVDLKKRELLDLLEDYLTIPDSSQPLPIEKIDEILKEASELSISGRKAKKANSWSDEWRTGVKSYTKAFGLLTDTISKIRPPIYKKLELDRLREKKNKFLIALSLAFLLGSIGGLIAAKVFL